MTKIKTLLILSLLIFSHYSMARSFINGEVEIQMSYSHIDSKTIPAGKVMAKIRRTNDHFACAIIVDGVNYTCYARDAVDDLTWIKLGSNDYAKILSGGIDTTVSPEVKARLETLITNQLTSLVIVIGRGGISFKESEDLFEDTVPDSLKIIVRAR